MTIDERCLRQHSVHAPHQLGVVDWRGCLRTNGNARYSAKGQQYRTYALHVSSNWKELADASSHFARRRDIRIARPSCMQANGFRCFRPRLSDVGSGRQHVDSRAVFRVRLYGRRKLRPDVVALRVLLRWSASRSNFATGREESRRGGRTTVAPTSARNGRQT